MIKLICGNCGREFERRESEVKRNESKGRRPYCSLICSGKVNNKHLPKNSDPIGERIKKFSDNHADEFSPFRWHYRTAKIHDKKRNREMEFSITYQDLKDQWERQEGICPLTGWKMKNMLNTSRRNQLERTPDRASLDRIDSSVGYIPSNIRFVCLMAQYAKNGWTDAEVYKFAEAVCKTEL